MSLKQQFKDLLKKIKKESGHSYKEIAQNSAVKVEVLKNAGSPSGRYFKVTQEDYNALKEAYPDKHNRVVSIEQNAFATLHEKIDNLSEILLKGQSEQVKQRHETITTKGKDIIDATIKAIAQKHNMSIEEVMVSFEKMLVERLKEDQSQDTKKG